MFPLGYWGDPKPFTPSNPLSLEPFNPFERVRHEALSGCPLNLLRMVTGLRQDGQFRDVYGSLAGNSDPLQGVRLRV